MIKHTYFLATNVATLREGKRNKQYSQRHGQYHDSLDVPYVPLDMPEP